MCINYISVNFDRTVDWEPFVMGLNDSIPENCGIAFDVGEDPLLSDDFCYFVGALKRPWVLRTLMFGPGFDCLRVNKLDCDEIVAVFRTNVHCNVYAWMRRVIRLIEAGYNVRVESQLPIRLEWLKRFATKPVEVAIEPLVVKKALKKGLRSHGEPFSCDGRLSCVWSDGKYYPCPHCVDGGWKYPVHAYGELGEPFERRGREKCYLIDCPLLEVD